MLLSLRCPVKSPSVIALFFSLYKSYVNAPPLCNLGTASLLRNSSVKLSNISFLFLFNSFQNFLLISYLENLHKLTILNFRSDIHENLPNILFCLFLHYVFLYVVAFYIIKSRHDYVISNFYIFFKGGFKL